MLVITRKDGERFLIRPPGGPDIWVTVTNTSHNKLGIGVDAPREVVIAREELVANMLPEIVIPPNKRLTEHNERPTTTPIGAAVLTKPNVKAD